MRFIGLVGLFWWRVVAAIVMASDSACAVNFGHAVRGQDVTSHCLSLNTNPGGVRAAGGGGGDGVDGLIGCGGGRAGLYITLPQPQY